MTNKKRNKKPKDKLKLKERIKIRLMEIPALSIAKREEQKHIPIWSEIKKEQKEFEKEALSMRPMILNVKAKKKRIRKKK